MEAAGTTTSVGSSLNPAPFGAFVTFTAMVSGGATTPTGQITFSIDGSPQEPTILGPTGMALYGTQFLSMGAHTVRASYAGDATHGPSSGALSPSQVIGSASTTTSVSSSVNPSTLGQFVTFAATIGGGTGTPTGSVTFFDGTNELGSDPDTRRGRGRLRSSVARDEFRCPLVSYPQR